MSVNLVVVGLVVNRHQAITWTDDEWMTYGPLPTNFSEIQNKIQQFYRWKFIRKCYLQACCVNSSSPSAAYLYVNWISIVSGNGMSPIRCQAFTWKLFIPENAFENVLCEMAVHETVGHDQVAHKIGCLCIFIINLSGSQQFSGSSIQNQVELSEWATGRFMHWNGGHFVQGEMS